MSGSCHICILLFLHLLTVMIALKSTDKSAMWMILGEIIAVFWLFLEQQDPIPGLAGSQAVQRISMEFLLFLSVPIGDPNVASFKVKSIFIMVPLLNFVRQKGRKYFFWIWRFNCSPEYYHRALYTRVLLWYCSLRLIFSSNWGAAEVQEMDSSIHFPCCEFLEIKFSVLPQSLFSAPDLVLVIQTFVFYTYQRCLQILQGSLLLKYKIASTSD